MKFFLKLRKRKALKRQIALYKGWLNRQVTLQRRIDNKIETWPPLAIGTLTEFFVGGDGSVTFWIEESHGLHVWRFSGAEKYNLFCQDVIRQALV